MPENSNQEVGNGNNTYPFFPDHVALEALIGLFLLGLLSLMTIVFYPELGPKANPNVTPEHIKPEWYFFPIFRWIKLTPEWLGLAGQAVGAALFVFWPFIDGFVTKRTNWKYFSPVAGVTVMTVLIIFMIWEAFI